MPQLEVVLYPARYFTKQTSTPSGQLFSLQCTGTNWQLLVFTEIGEFGHVK